MFDTAANVSDNRIPGSAEVQPAEQSRRDGHGDMPETKATIRPGCLAAPRSFLSQCEFCGVCPPDVVFFGLNTQTEIFLCVACWVAHATRLVNEQKIKMP